MHKPNGPDHVMRMIRHLMRQHQKQLHTLLQDYDIYPGQPPLMFALSRGPGRSQNELAHELDIKAATLTVMLNRMEKNDIVRRETDQRDQRVYRIYLTDKGSAVLEEIRETLNMLEQRSMEGFTEEEKLLLKGLLSRVGDNMKRYDQSDSRLKSGISDSADPRA